MVFSPQSAIGRGNQHPYGLGPRGRTVQPRCRTAFSFLLTNHKLCDPMTFDQLDSSISLIIANTVISCNGRPDLAVINAAATSIERLAAENSGVLTTHLAHQPPYPATRE
jgi:hypothetical protein